MDYKSNYNLQLQWRSNFYFNFEWLIFNVKTIATRLLTSNRLEPSSYNLINCGWLVHQEKNMYQNYSTLESGSPRWTVELDYKKYNWNCMNEDGMTARFDSVDELGLAKHIYIYIYSRNSPTTDHFVPTNLGLPLWGGKRNQAIIWWNDCSNLD